MVSSPVSGKKRVLLYFGHAPMEGAGSAIIVLRHLRRLATHGWTILVVSDWGQDLAVCEAEGWPVFHLSHRKPWWPPYYPRNRLLCHTRHWLWAGECHGFLNHQRPDAVFTYLSAFTDFMSQVALAYAERYDVPLSLIAHDDPVCFSRSLEEGVKLRARYQDIVERSHRNWFASPQLASIYDLPQERRSTLPPIPDGYAASPDWQPEFAQCPLIVYAGNFWPAQLPLLARLGREVAAAGGRLMLLVRKTREIKSLCREAPVIWHEPFRENREALRFLAENAAGLLISYAETSESMPWIRTSFPSKLIEYTHLGLPLMIMAPPESAVAQWAEERQFPDRASTDTPGPITAFVEALKDEKVWHAKAAIPRKFAETEFDPERIQEAFEASLTR
ncbi:MAG: hypothetical protein QOE70_6433 [Chthoniobacter sp.]|jgi:hypothetical protein|nr:hypothetical protein [Chthoniobacter sp.]